MTHCANAAWRTSVLCAVSKTTGKNPADAGVVAAFSPEHVLPQRLQPTGVSRIPGIDWLAAFFHCTSLALQRIGLSCRTSQPPRLGRGRSLGRQSVSCRSDNSYGWLIMDVSVHPISTRGRSAACCLFNLCVPGRSASARLPAPPRPRTNGATVQTLHGHFFPQFRLYSQRTYSCWMSQAPGVVGRRHSLLLSPRFDGHCCPSPPGSKGHRSNFYARVPKDHQLICLEPVTRLQRVVLRNDCFPV